MLVSYFCNDFNFYLLIPLYVDTYIDSPGPIYKFPLNSATGFTSLFLNFLYSYIANEPGNICTFYIYILLNFISSAAFFY